MKLYGPNQSMLKFNVFNKQGGGFGVHKWKLSFIFAILKPIFFKLHVFYCVQWSKTEGPAEGQNFKKYKCKKLSLHFVWATFRQNKQCIGVDIRNELISRWIKGIATPPTILLSLMAWLCVSDSFE